MGVPAHDERDFEFAKKYNLPIRVVVAPEGWDGHDLDAAYIAPGVQVNSGEFDGLPSEQGKEVHLRLYRGQRMGRTGSHLPPP